MALESELATYEKNLPAWKTDRAGKFVLIKGEEIAGFYDTYEDAINEGYAKYKLAPFLVKQIHAVEDVQFISRLVDATALTAT